MHFRQGVTLVELVVIICIAGMFVAVAVPKFISAAIKDKMWEGMTTLMTFESAELAHLAGTTRLVPADSLAFSADSSESFFFAPEGAGRFRATAKTQIGPIGKGSWLHTAIDTTGGIPRIVRSCSPGDTVIVKKYLPVFFK